jgi:hypothetical protein
MMLHASPLASHENTTGKNSSLTIRSRLFQQTLQEPGPPPAAELSCPLCTLPALRTRNT